MNVAVTASTLSDPALHPGACMSDAGALLIWQAGGACDLSSCCAAALEKQIQALFQKVLGKEQISCTANFFAEGGSQEQVGFLAMHVNDPSACRCKAKPEDPHSLVLIIGRLISLLKDEAK